MQLLRRGVFKKSIAILFFFTVISLLTIYIIKYLSREALITTINLTISGQQVSDTVSVDFSMLSIELQQPNELSKVLSRGYTVEYLAFDLKEGGWIYRVDIQGDYFLLCLVRPSKYWGIYFLQLPKQQSQS